MAVSLVFDVQSVEVTYRLLDRVEDAMQFIFHCHSNLSRDIPSDILAINPSELIPCTNYDAKTTI